MAKAKPERTTSPAARAYYQMDVERCCIHLLTIASSYKHILHWQITARVCLGSLLYDERITDETRIQVSELIGNKRILDYQTSDLRVE